MRLINGGNRCSGRVELDYNGAWGTVCDDNWDLVDAAVVCQQLGCGWAIQALNASYFQKGTGPIHLGQVKCSGLESYLWDCPAERTPDCGHTREAGVICSDHQAWRLTGGLDACAGRVEVYYRNIWNTVCDSSWYQDEANVLCRSLGCSEKASTPRVPFNHTLLGKMYYECSGDEDSLASCKWRYNKATLCDQFRAAGVICNGSLGLENWTDTTVTPAVTPAVTSVSLLPSPCWTRPENWDLKPSYQTLHVICVILGLLLFLAILSHIITILLRRRKKNGTLGMADIASTAEQDCAISSASISAPVLVNHSMQVSTTGVHNDYREIPTSLPKGEGLTTFSSPLVNCESGPGNSSFNSSDYDDMWS
ncbi:hypothetical protein JD844_022107 [Phrynosoma platyrhinos]|uniref:SRCR domain-containing protein n=1 Tax=Phrynosoma platyrhinos TaxID=52577 RepID=A0ABQ7SVH6_PHRPL|nr:hypothetical protein JD844_022107 [Phrynosoma platyrhinos]